MWAVREQFALTVRTVMLCTQLPDAPQPRRTLTSHKCRMMSKRSRKNQHVPHVGTHHRIYSLLLDDDSGNIVYTFSWSETGSLESLIEIYLRDGNSLHDVDSMQLTYESPELAEVRSRLISDYDKYRNKSHKQFVYKLSIVEGFFLALLPQSDFSRYLMQLQSRLIPLNDGKFKGNPVRAFIPFSSLKEIELVAFIQYLITPKDMATAFSIDGCCVNGRGVGYKSLEGFITVIRTIHRAAGISDGLCPTHGENVKAIRKDVFDRYHPEGALALDFATFLPKAYVAVFGSDLPNLDKLMRWTSLLIAINIFARASEITDYCPLAEDIVFPTDHVDWCADGLPRYINRRYCCKAVKTITNKVGGINYTVWVDDESHEVNLTYENWSDICKMIFDGADISGASTHSIRKSAAVWAARCGAEEYQIREAGRWNSGDTYMIYVKSGKAMSSLAATRKDGAIDPIRRVWVFHPTVFLK